MIGKVGAEAERAKQVWIPSVILQSSSPSSSSAAFRMYERNTRRLLSPFRPSSEKPSRFPNRRFGPLRANVHGLENPEMSGSAGGKWQLNQKASKRRIYTLKTQRGNNIHYFNIYRS
jgi:hypothetical protein